MTDTLTADYTPRERGLLRRQKFIDAATTVFMQSGYEAASLQDIVAQAGGSLATLYRLFGNKEGLFKAVIEQKCSDIQDRLSAPTLTSKDPEYVLKQMGMHFLELMISPEAGAVHRLLIAESGRYSKLREFFLTMAPERSIMTVTDYLKSLVNNGYLTLAPEDCKLAAMQFIGMFKSDYHMRNVFGEKINLSKEDKERFVSHAVKLFLHGCSPCK